MRLIPAVLIVYTGADIPMIRLFSCSGHVSAEGLTRPSFYVGHLFGVLRIPSSLLHSNFVGGSLLFVDRVSSIPKKG